MVELKKNQLLKTLLHNGKVRYGIVDRINQKTYTIDWRTKVYKDTLMTEYGDQWYVVSEEERLELLKRKESLSDVATLLEEAAEIIAELEGFKEKFEKFDKALTYALAEYSRIS